MFSKFEKYLLGPNSQQIKTTILQSSAEVVNIDFGKLLGSVYFVKPGEKIAIAELLNRLDTQPKGRQPMAAVDEVLAGSSLLTSTDTNREYFHGVFKHSLSRPLDYIEFLLDALKASLTKENFNLTDMVATPIRQAIKKGLFTLGEDSSEFDQALKALSQANRDMEKEFSTEIRQILISIHYPSLLKFALSVLAYQAKQQYSDHIKKFIQLQAESILNDIHKYARDEPVHRVISLSIIGLIKKENEFWAKNPQDFLSHLSKMEMKGLLPYLENKFIKTLPGMMVAGDSITAIVTGAITALGNNKKLLNKLLAEIETENLALDGDTATLKQKIDSNKKTGGLLHRLYLEALRLRSIEESIDDKPFSSGVVWRYTNQDINLSGHTIPANSTIAVLTTFYFYDEKKWPNPADFKPSRFKDRHSGGLNQSMALSIHGVFSQGNSACPASLISQYLFKVFILYLVKNYDFTIEHKINEKRSSNCNISLKPQVTNVVELEQEPVSNFLL